MSSFASLLPALRRPTLRANESPQFGERSDSFFKDKPEARKTHSWTIHEGSAFDLARSLDSGGTESDHDDVRFVALAFLVPFLVVAPVYQVFPGTIAASNSIQDLQAEHQFRSYSVRIFRDEAGLGRAEILKDGKRVWADSDGVVYRVGHVYERTESEPGVADLRIGTDITGDGLPDLVISRWSGGLHCCFDFFVFELQPKFRLLTMLQGGHSDHSSFQDLDGDSIPEFLTADWVFAYWQTSFAFSASPRIVLRYRDGQYQLALDLMKKQPQSDTEIDDAAREMCRIRSGSELWDETHFGTLTRHFTNLLYSGNHAEARRYLRGAFCGDVTEESAYLADFSKQIEKSRYWPELRVILAIR